MVWTDERVIDDRKIVRTIGWIVDLTRFMVSFFVCCYLHNFAGQDIEFVINIFNLGWKYL